jgi:hypothetical protein
VTQPPGGNFEAGNLKQGPPPGARLCGSGGSVL